MGFFEDYKRAINARHELILIRARNDNNCVMGNPALARDRHIQNTMANASRYAE